MKTRPRLSEWPRGGGRDSPGPGFTSRLYNDTVVDSPSTVANYQYLLGALRSRAPGAWSSNLLELSRHLTSSIFLAINTMQKHAAAAEMKVMEKTYDPEIGDEELPHTDPAVELFTSPNDDDDWPDLAEQATQQKGLTGIALQWQPPTGENDIPGEMYIIPTASSLPWPPSPIYPSGSYLVQPYYPSSGRPSPAMAA